MTIVPVYNMVIVPYTDIYIQTDNYVRMAGRKPEEEEKIFFLILKEDQPKRLVSEDSFYKIGVSAVIREVSENGFVSIRTGGRVNLDEVHVNSNHTIGLTVSRRPEIEDLDDEVEKEHVDALKSRLLQMVTGYQWEAVGRHLIAQWQTMAEIACGCSPWLTASAAERYAFLEEDSKAKRMELMEKAVYEFAEMTLMGNDAKNAQEKEYQKSYREAAIKKQMEYLQKELDEMHPETVTDERRLELKIAECGMNEDAEAEARKVLNRMKQGGQNSPEYGMMNDYLEFMTSLKWQAEEMGPINIREAEAVLEEDHFGLKKVKERIIQQIAVMNLNQKQSGSILLFVGAPGTGKTSIGKSIAKALNRKYVRVSLGGVRDEADIRGHRRTYIGAMPGRIMDGIQKCGASNPVMVLDEVDKLSSSYNGDPASALLEVLDPEQNHTFTDHYMNVPYDLSNVFFICTANTVDTIPEPLLNRMEVIQFPGYTETDKYQIAVRHLLPRAMKDSGIPADYLEVTDDAVRTIITDYTREAGVRGLKKRMDTLCRSAAVKLVKLQQSQMAEERSENAPDGILKVEEGVSEPKSVHIRIDAPDVREYLDMHPVHHEHILSDNRPGIVTGLAWTNSGGEILFIETLFTKGSGKIIITGQLGDVMKESAQIAVSLVKAMYPDKAEVFEKNDLHIHVPDGATPKDGPSAGIALTTAISSLVNEHAVNPVYAMTGEVSLRGVVKPIGGLPEKLMAAKRAGIKKVLIPEENKDDLKEVAEEVVKSLDIIPVSQVNEVLKMLVN
ncbi:MAG: endopeptidase La [Blautia sp.]|nr:endopeptidase La [Blautia sp.]